MPLFYLKYSIMDDTAARTQCLTIFGAMSADDDARDAGDQIRILGRWTTVGKSAGFCICEATNAAALHAWLLNWATVATIEAFPIVDDNAARRIILGTDELPFTVAYDQVGAAAAEGESLYVIEYQFQPGKRAEGHSAFAGMTAEQDRDDAGENTCLGRWHDLGRGSGVAVCSSPSEVALHAWAYRWTSLCDCTIVPVVTDCECRANIASKPQFQPPPPTLAAVPPAVPRGANSNSHCCTLS